VPDGAAGQASGGTELPDVRTCQSSQWRALPGGGARCRRPAEPFQTPAPAGLSLRAEQACHWMELPGAGGPSRYHRPAEHPGCDGWPLRLTGDFVSAPNATAAGTRRSSRKALEVPVYTSHVEAFNDVSFSSNARDKNR